MAVLLKSCIRGSILRGVFFPICQYLLKCRNPFSFSFCYYIYIYIYINYSCTWVLWPFWHTLYLYSLYIDVCFSPTLTCVVSFVSLCTWFLLLVCNLLFLFHTKMPWWVLFKVFQKYRLSKSTCHKLSSCKVFQEFVLR